MTMLSHGLKILILYCWPANVYSVQRRLNVKQSGNYCWYLKQWAIISLDHSLNQPYQLYSDSVGCYSASNFTYM